MVRVIAWGKTGRVEVEGPTTPLPYVYVDGTEAGWLYSPDSMSPQWGARTWEPADSIDNAFPSRDAAVMWVLRRVDAKLWREERGEVWRVCSYGGRGGLHVINPADNQCQGCYDAHDLPRAITRAHREASEAHL